MYLRVLLCFYLLLSEILCFKNNLLQKALDTNIFFVNIYFANIVRKYIHKKKTKSSFSC